ncbi:MAG TPA: 3-phosphoshikimate 1-carboxyvinyltransferase [Pyrinomonadaceae bacterium]|nr:3-phosphoshikimate 1-carboxyvinyltransferase [Pyrinomonadaceae bacterium]
MSSLSQPQTNSLLYKNHTVTVAPVKRLRGEMRVPGDKSISHRAAMLSSLAQGESLLENFSSAQDCAATLECFRSLGVDITRDGVTVVIEGRGAAGLQEPDQILDAQNSGTTMRLLAGLLAGQPFASTITGDASLRARPMQRVAEPLRLMGAEIELESNGCAPIRVTGSRPLQPIHYRLPVASAQIKSAVLLAGLAAKGITTVEEPAPTRDHTERMLREFGVPVEQNGNQISVQGGGALRSRRFVIPGDISSAAFFIGAAVVLPGSDLLIRDVGLNPTRTAFLSALKSMGAEIQVQDERPAGGEPLGSIRVHGNASTEPRTLEVSGETISNLIDELPLLAFIAASLGWEMKLRDAKELRVKESDRIAATVENLSRMGAHIEASADGWHLHSNAKLRGAQVSSFEDHRIAMASAVAALAAEGPTEIAGAGGAVDVSLPEFWSLLESVTE